MDMKSQLTDNEEIGHAAGVRDRRGGRRPDLGRPAAEDQYIYIYIYIHTHIHIHMHIYIYIYIYIRM